MRENKISTLYSASSIIRTSIIWTLDYPNYTAAQKISKFHYGLTLISDEAAPPSPRSVIVSQEARGVRFLHVCCLNRVSIAEAVKFLRNRWR